MGCRVLSWALTHAASNSAHSQGLAEDTVQLSPNQKIRTGSGQLCGAPNFRAQARKE